MFRPRLAMSTCTQAEKGTKSENLELETRLRLRRHRARRLAEEDCGLELAMLARQLDLDRNDVQELKVVFDSYDKARSGLLDKTGFKALIRAAFLLDKNDEIPEELFDSRWFELQSQENRIPTIDFEGFLRWYKASWFVEELLVNQAVRLVRGLARRHGLGFANVERIYRVFEEFDEDRSGTIELPEFRNLSCRLLGTSQETQMSEVMFSHLWTEAAGQMDSIDFETFLLWYTRHFGEEKHSGHGSLLLQEYYRSMRPHTKPAAEIAEHWTQNADAKIKLATGGKSPII